MAKKQSRRNRSRSQESKNGTQPREADARRNELRLELAIVIVSVIAAMIGAIVVVPAIQQALLRPFGLDKPDISLEDIAFCEGNSKVPSNPVAPPPLAATKQLGDPCDDPNVRNNLDNGPLLLLRVSNRTTHKESIRRLKVELDDLRDCGAKGTSSVDDSPISGAVIIPANQLPRERRDSPLTLDLYVPNLEVHPEDLKWYRIPLRLDSSALSIRGRGRFSIVTVAGTDTNSRSIEFGIPNIPDFDCNALIRLGP